ncbi:MAG: GcrA cell cycle regulator [Proteobacteria bacterium]|nr:GcrA cell cycle regulator [Pseudomonadota bacterium]
MTEWYSEVIDKLRILWSEGHSTAEIGRRLHISKNAVVGKSHRWQLPPRPSPIRRGSSANPQKTKPKASARRAPAGALLGVSEAILPMADVIFAPLTSAAMTALAPSYGATPEGSARRTDQLSKTPCCWPIGEPSKPSFSFCSANAVAGKPYCPAHCGVAYRPSRHHYKDDLLATAIDRSERARTGAGV